MIAAAAVVRVVGETPGEYATWREEEGERKIVAAHGPETAAADEQMPALH